MKKQRIKVITAFLMIAILFDFNVNAAPWGNISKSLGKAARRGVKVKPKVGKYSEKASQESEKSTGLFSSCSNKEEDKTVDYMDRSVDVVNLALSVCPICKGEGVYDHRRCVACNGTGKRKTR